MAYQGLNFSASPEGITAVEMVASIAHTSFGLGYAALNLSAALVRAGANAFLVAIDDERDALEACENAGFPRERLIRGSLVGPARMRFSPFLLHKLSSVPTDSMTIVHLHGLWTYASYAASRFSGERHLPLVVSPHGSLEPYALSVSRMKKSIASFLYERGNIRKASCLWALSELERASIRNAGFAGRVAVIPNGVRPADALDAREVAAFRCRHGIDPNDRILLFLSRIAKKKNLSLLLNAFQENLKRLPGWVLLVAGSDESGHLREIKSLIRRLGIERSVRFLGEVSGTEKSSALHSASVFVLPSHSEGLPIAVLEAMEYGKPVLITDGWTLPIRTNLQFGWIASTDEQAFGVALVKAMSCSEERLAALGRNGHTLAREFFDWDSIAARTINLYSDLIAGHIHEGRLMPPCGACSAESYQREADEGR